MVMNYKERYNQLLETNKRLEKELELFSSKSKGNHEIINDMIFRVFHSTTYLMAISKLDSGQYVDVNDIFLKTLGYRREEIIGHTPDEIQIFSDIEESNKYIKLISRLKSIKDYPVTLKTKNGEEKSYLFSAETVQVEDDSYLLNIFSEISTSKDRKIKESQGNVLDEIFETVSSYLALFSFGDDNKFHIIDLNHKVEEVEFISKNEVLGKCVDETPLINRIKLIELLHHLRITGNAHKLAASPKGDDSEGYYMGFLLTSGNIVITWEPGNKQKNLDDLYKQGVVFEKFAEMLPEMIYEVDLTGKILYTNQQGLRFFGYSKEDLAKGTYISKIFPEDYQKMIENLKELKAPGQISSNEYFGRRKDGSLVPIVTHSFATFLDDKIISYRGVVTDVSKQREYENQIRREKAFLEHLIDSTPAAIAITSPTGIISIVNREFTTLFGYTTEEAVNKNIDDLVVPDDLKDEAIRIDSLASGNKKEIRHTIRKDKSGNKIHVSLVATAVVINNEVIAHLGIYRDITTERKNQLLQEILYNISTSALKQYDIKEIYPIIVQELSKIWDTNNFFIALYDKTKETLSLPFFSDEKDNFNEIPAKKTITGWVIKNNKSVLLKENDQKLLEESGDIDLVGTPCKVWMGVPLKVEENTIGAICLQDYNDENKFSQDDLNVLEFIANQIALALQRRMMLDNLIHARQKAEEAAKSKQLFMSTMSHEIRTPLNEVIGITNLLLQGTPRDDQMDFIKTLKFSGNHLLTLVNDVLDYNKMESGKIVFEQTQFNLGDFLDEIKRSYSFRSKAKHISFDIKKSGDVPNEVIGDPIRLNQILSNLLSNALKFTNQGSITVNITEIKRKGNQSNIEFEVSDTGIGIPKDKHEHIFESFTQASPDTTRHYGGTGLGLAICKKLIELQGGIITLESEPGVGSVFRFAMTFGISEKGSQAQKAELPESYTGLEGKKILVAEDNKINFFVANKFLVGWGIKVTHAENGQLALDILENESFDLILMDLHMPVLDGIEATRIIRKSENPKIKNIPIVALTAAIMSESHDKIEDLNINDYVLKPFKPHDLFERIRKNIR
ncbi:MAG: PAS domain S-box protein [Bacteroidetes bacterium]|nr:MAG: PAS domain S-box protein [Bacteroidota bacterium]